MQTCRREGKRERERESNGTVMIRVIYGCSLKLPSNANMQERGKDGERERIQWYRDDQSNIWLLS